MKKNYVLVSIVCMFVLMLFTGCSEVKVTSDRDFEIQTSETITENKLVYSPREEIDYFIEIAFGSEWDGENFPIRKWKDNPRISVYGNPTNKDMESLNAVISDINNLQNTINLEIIYENPNIEIYYIPLKEFNNYIENPAPNNWGLFYYWWDENYSIIRSKILISTDMPNQVERSHLIREELTQALGLVRDSSKYEDSIFYQEWTRTTQFSDIDKALIKLMYDERIKAGMSIGEVQNILSVYKN